MTESGGRELVGRTVRPITRAQIAAVVLGLGAIIFLQFQRFEPFIMVYPVLWLGAAMLRRRRPTMVTAQGISRPWRLRSTLDWSEVDAVAAPEPGAWAVHLHLNGGKSLALDDISAQHADEVAALGGKPVRPAPRTKFPPPAEREKTAVQIEADVRRQAQALAEHRKAMAAESARLHRRPENAAPEA